jgi:hypothetical protein
MCVCEGRGGGQGVCVWRGGGGRRGQEGQGVCVCGPGGGRGMCSQELIRIVDGAWRSQGSWFGWRSS